MRGSWSTLGYCRFGRKTVTSDGVLVLAQDHATLASYRAGQYEPRINATGWWTIQSFQSCDRRLRDDVSTDGTLQSSGGRIRLSVVTGDAVVLMVVVMVVLLRLVMMVVV